MSHSVQNNTGRDLLPHSRLHWPSPFCKTSNASCLHSRPTLFCPLWPKLFADDEKEARIKNQEVYNNMVTSGQSKEAVAQTQKRGRVVGLCGGAFLRLDLLVTFGSSQK